MSGLSYLCDYGDSEESDTENTKPKKVKLRTPDLSGVALIPIENHVDDPELHDGRYRTFPHVRGNWASYAYFKYPRETSLLNLIDKLQVALASVGEVSHKCDDLHISISKTVVLKYHMITTFTESLREAFAKFESFELSFDSVDVYVNEDNSRTFIALKADFFSNKFLLKRSIISYEYNLVQW
ncbi:unnamed protein product [Leptidea sinapis]|uniref:U6 snRNA phosphodiesterase 1 n=1 Tax=Leptidea sinapis TaxID=189913 RepID=A0A5E4PP24_9NEOP|nr:unnamed protein product [Leptidea sinapis]